MAKNKHPAVRVRELVDVAFTYFEDGAFYTSAARLREAAAILEAHARACDPTEPQDDDDEEMDKLVAEARVTGLVR